MTDLVCMELKLNCVFSVMFKDARLDDSFNSDSYSCNHNALKDKLKETDIPVCLTATGK